MVDVAKIVIEADSKPVRRAEDALIGFGKAAKKTDAANDNLNKGFNKTSRGAKRMATVVGASAKKMIGSFKLLGTVVSAVVAAFGALSLRSFIRNSITADAAIAQLNQTLKSTKFAAGLSSQELQDMASALQTVTKFGDEAIVELQALLLTFTKIGGGVFERALTSILDVSTAMKIDLKSSAIQVGKALNDPILGMTALSRSGITFTQSQKDMVKQLVKSGDILTAQKIILKELETQFGGSAAAARDTLGGALTALGNSWGDAFELSDVVTSDLKNAISDLTDAVSDPAFVTFIQLIGKALVFAFEFAVKGVALLANAISGLVRITKTVLNFIIGSFVGAYDSVVATWRQLPNAFGDLTIAAANAMIGGLESLLNSSISGLNSFADKINGISSKLGIPEIGKIGKVEFGRVDNPFQGVSKGVGETIAKSFKDALGVDYFATIKENAEVLAGSVEKIAPSFDKVTKSAKKTKETFDKFNQDTFKGLFTDLSDGLREGKSLFKSLGDVALNALNRIADKLIDMGTSNLFAGLFGSKGGPGGGNFLSSIVGSLFGGGKGFTSGGLFADGASFKNGSVVDTPTAFGMSGGRTGVMGEGGQAEAVMPLKRGSNGQLGVQVQGGGGGGPVNVEVNNYYTLDGAVDSKTIQEQIAATAVRTAQQTQAAIKQNLIPWINQYETDGALGS